MIAMWRPPISLTSRSVVISASASSSVVKRCGQNVSARVPMRRFLMWGRKVGSLNGSKYSLIRRVFMNIGSPPVKRMSDTCEARMRGRDVSTARGGVGRGWGGELGQRGRG